MRLLVYDLATTENRRRLESLLREYGFVALFANTMCSPHPPCAFRHLWQRLRR